MEQTPALAYGIKFTGRKGSGPIDVPTNAGDYVLMLYCFTDNLAHYPASFNFESIISVAGQIQQLTDSDQSGTAWGAILAKEG